MLDDRERDTMESIDIDAYKKMLADMPDDDDLPVFAPADTAAPILLRYPDHEQKREASDDDRQEPDMASIDIDKYKEMLENGQTEEEEAEAYTPIEVKSTQHIERQKQEEQKKENALSAKQAANEVFDWLESILMAVVIIVLVFTFLLRVNTVDGESMEPTLTGGQKLIVTDLFYTPRYNDIVIIQAANLDGGIPIVKRIIGLPGDRINIDFDNGVVYRNGEPLRIEINNDLIYEDGHTILTYTTRNMEMISGQDYYVPEDCYFVLGDNRNNSKDSRTFSEVGFVNKNYIAGHAIFSIFPFDTFGTL